jgi:predicted nucleic acid-binding protein
VSRPYVLDSFAVLALLGRESGGEQVKELLQKAQQEQVRVLMTWVNVGEVAYIVERRWDRDRAYQTIGTLEATRIEIVEVGRELALKAAQIKARHPLAYADAFSAALALSEDGVLVTGDPEFRQLEDLLSIEWLPQES